ncbi:MAG: alkaline phosphatase [Chitinophagales bacterium]|nr:MAG: alkaline phosphatase [Chitinophagales bacterium]
MKQTLTPWAIAILLISSPAFAQTPAPPFVYGVASGDPLPNQVIIWTKLAPADTTQPATVNWRVAADTAFIQIVQSGLVTTDNSTDFTVKVDVAGLQPNTWYYYDFETGGIHSIRGRTKTAPVGQTTHIRFAVVTCAKYSKGYFNAYESISARNDLDAVIHLGDYIYEGNGSSDDIRPFDPAYRCSTLIDYRTRYRQYHQDLSLIKARQNFPWINVWDDHETSNDAWQNGSEHWPDSAGFAALKTAALKVYFEWIPIRQDSAHPTRIYRQFQYGNLVDLFMLDTRLEGREKQYPFADSNMTIINDTNRTLLGHAQYNWLINGLSSSSAHWRVIAQQVMMAPALLAGKPLNEDQWDGYPAERAKLFQYIMQNDIDNIIVVTGDVHASFANDLPLDVQLYDDATGNGSVGVEFITPAVVSSQSAFGNVPFSIVKANDPHIQYADFTQRGYLILDITEAKVQADFYYVSTTDTPVYTLNLGASLYTLSGTRHIYRQPVSVNRDPTAYFALLPNPAKNILTIQPGEISGSLTFQIFDTNGAMIKQFPPTTLRQNRQDIHLDISKLPSGTYILKIYSGAKLLHVSKFVVAK